MLQDRRSSLRARRADGTSWVKQAQMWAEDLSVSAQTKAWTGRQDFIGHGLPNLPRVHAVVNLTAVQKVRDAGAPLHCLQDSQKHRLELKKTILDFSQNPNRKAHSKKCLRCLCSSTQLFRYDQDRTLFASEYLRLQGWGLDIAAPEGCKIREMACQGMALPCLGTVVWSLFLLKGLPSERDLPLNRAVSSKAYTGPAGFIIDC